MTKKKKRLQKHNQPRLLPQDYRRISASRRQAIEFSLRFLGCAFLLVMFLINIVGAGLAPAHGRPQVSPLQYIETTNKFLAVNDFQTASYFNKTGLIFFPTSIDLLSQEDLIYEKINEPELIRKEILTWEKIAASYPSYRDAWAMLAMSNMKLGNDQEVNKSLEKIKEINPNWEPLKLF